MSIKRIPCSITILCLIATSSALSVLLYLCKMDKDDTSAANTQMIRFSLKNDFSLSKVTPDKRYVELTNSEYWCVEYGLSAGPHGLIQMFKLESTGKLTIFYREPLTSFVECTLDLKPELINILYKEIVARSLMHLGVEYIAEDVWDANSAVLLIRQGAQAKRVKCDAYFPDEVLFFLNLIDHTIQSLENKKHTWRSSENADSTSDNLLDDR